MTKKILSWGLGLQSTLLLEKSAAGELPLLDAAIVADTGAEHQYSYDVFNFYAPRAIKAGITVIKIGGQDIMADNFRHVTLPLFVQGGESRARQIRRKCTRDYKIRPIQREIRTLLGVNQRGRLAAHLVQLWLGITVDEIHRAKDSRVAYIDHKFPLLDLGFKRDDCTAWFEDRGLPIPGKSSCVFCPYKKPGEWAEMSETQPEVITLIADLETHINQNGLVKIGGQRKNVTFLPTGPLLQADFFNLPQADLDMCDGGFCHS